MSVDLQRWRQLVRPTVPVLDFHTHPVRDFGPYPVVSAAADAAVLVGAARRAGVLRLAVSSLGPGCPPTPTAAQWRAANEYVLRMRDAEPAAILPLCYVSPEFPDAAAREVERCVRQEGMVGVKLWVARRATDPGLDPIAETAAALGVPILQHAWLKTEGQMPGESFPEDAANLARRFPGLRLVAAHLNGINPRGIEALRACASVCVDTSGGDPQNGMVELAVARLGAERVIYGSDAPIRHPAVMLSKVLGARLDSAATRAILWDNAARLLPSWANVAPVPGGG